MNRRNFISGVLSISACVLATACVYYPEPGYGPPPHAPAHGYRRRHRHGVDLVYDAGLGVYVVVGRPDYYYLDGHFYRYRGDHWESSRHPDGRWHRRSHEALPPGLRRKRTGKPGRGRGRPPGRR